MKIRPQITKAEPRIKRPACLSPSPKKRKTLPEKTCPATVPQKRLISPIESSQPRATAISASPDRLQLGVGREQGLGKHVVEGANPHEGDHHGLVDGTADPRRASGRSH